MHSPEDGKKHQTRRNFLGQALTAAGTAIAAPSLLNQATVAQSDHGQCGACTVLVDGQRVYSCLALAIMQEGKQIVTVEGLAKGDVLHPVQTAFIENDGFQCGYCTPGQICASVALLDEVKRGCASAVTADLAQLPQLTNLSEAEIKERLSGNLCRCSAYNGIVAAVQQVTGQTPPSPAATMLVREAGVPA